MKYWLPGIGVVLLILAIAQCTAEPPPPDYITEAAEQQSLSLSAFHTDIEDLIDFTVLSYEPFAGENRNVAAARIRGIEAAWSYTGSAWQARSPKNPFAKT